MWRGAMYSGSDPELVAARLHAKRLLKRFNDREPGDSAGRLAILRSLLRETGEGPAIESPFMCDYGFNITLGDGVFMKSGCVLLNCAPITIGRKTLLAPGVHIYTATHPTDPDLRGQGLEMALPETIGRHVWIGGGVQIGPGVTIGDDSVIGTGSVVVRNIPSGVVAFGNPCRVSRPVRDADRV